MVPFLQRKILNPYVTKIGGIPVWLNNNKPPTENVCKCKICGDWMYLLCQCYAPLPDSVYHCVIYVWACNRRECMRKNGSISVLRFHLVDKDYLKAQQQKEEQKKKKVEKKATGFGGVPQGFQLGDVWGASNSFGSNNTKSFGSSNTSNFGEKPFGASNTNTFGTKPFGLNNTALFGSNDNKTNTTSSLSSIDTKNNNNSKNDHGTLAEHLSKLHLKEETTIAKQQIKTPPIDMPPVNIDNLPSFPGEYIYITPEVTNKDADMGIDMTKYQEYIDMESELFENNDNDNDDHGEGGTWANEQYEKQQLPRGVDKQFKKFTERVAYEPSQCLRYEWNGLPLLYHELRSDNNTNNQHHEKCHQCGQSKIFEMQLMPNILSLLPTSEYALKNKNQQQQQSKSKMDSFNMGMEFGTILIYVCKNDCHPGDVLDTSYVLETAIAQYELD
ncbi:unnamed protein product [Cunninghamella echinulata]